MEDNKNHNSFEKINNFLSDIQDDIYEAQDSKLGELNDIIMEFLVDYKYYGYKLNTNILQINFPGTSDWCYMFSIPQKEYDNKSYLLDLETYPVYFIEFDTGNIQKISNNFREFIRELYDKNIEQFSKNIKKQEIPELTELSEEMQQFYIDNPNAP